MAVITRSVTNTLTADVHLFVPGYNPLKPPVVIPGLATVDLFTVLTGDELQAVQNQLALEVANGTFTVAATVNTTSFNPVGGGGGGGSSAGPLGSVQLSDGAGGFEADAIVFDGVSLVLSQVSGPDSTNLILQSIDGNDVVIHADSAIVQIDGAVYTAEIHNPLSGQNLLITETQGANILIQNENGQGGTVSITSDEGLSLGSNNSGIQMNAQGTIILDVDGGAGQLTYSSTTLAHTGGDLTIQVSDGQAMILRAGLAAGIQIENNQVGFGKPAFFDLLDTTARDALTPSEGWMIYNTTTHQPEFYNGTAWAAMTA